MSVMPFITILSHLNVPRHIRISQMAEDIPDYDRLGGGSTTPLRLAVLRNVDLIPAIAEWRKDYLTKTSLRLAGWRQDDLITLAGWRQDNLITLAGWRNDDLVMTDWMAS